MDNGIVVAISTLGTALIAGSVTLLSKVIDAFQKKNEQAMVVKTTYINKKIEAGQNAIGRNNVVFHKTFTERSLLLQLKKGLNPSEEFIATIVAGRKAISNLLIENDDFTDLYFDINSNYYEEINGLVNEAQELIIAINITLVTKDRSNLLENVDKAIAVFDKMLYAYNRINAFIREDLAKYDVV